MHHYDEHTLELYVLEAGEVQSLRTDIQRHLRECAGCRELVERIAAFYMRAEDGVSGEKPVPRRSTKVMVRADHHPEVFFGPPSHTLAVSETRTLMRFVRNNPVKTALGSGLFIIAAFLLARGMLDASHPNPGYTVLNNQKHFLEVYTGDNQFLWSVPWGHSIDLSAPLRRSQMAPGVVADLQADGMNEVVTAISHLGGVEVPAANVRVFSADGSLLWEKAFNESIRFKDQDFPPSYFVRGLVVGDFDGDGKTEIVVNIPHRHSPNLLVRLNADGEETGRYVHYGHFFDLELVDLDGDGREELIASGIDDVDSSATIAVLDPSKIVGTIESQVTRGFGFKVSEAEKQYVRLPRNEFDVHLLRKPRIFGVSSIGEDFIMLSGGSEYPVGEGGAGYALDYIFDKNMKLKEIKYTDSARMAYTRFVQEGKFRGRIDGAFLRELEKRVLYWDAGGWRENVSEPIRTKEISKK